MSLRAGILIIILASVAITDVLATWAVSERLEEGARREADHQARGRAVMTRTLLDQRLETLAANAEAIALYPAVVGAVEGANTQPLVRWADSVAARQGIHVKVFDARGTALAHGHNADRLGPMEHAHEAATPGQNDMLTGLRLALNGQINSGVETSDEIGLAIRGFAPIRSSGDDAVIVGAVMLADPLDDILLTQLMGGDGSGASLHVAQFEAGRLRNQPFACTTTPNGLAATCIVRLEGPDGAQLTPHLVQSVSLVDVALARGEAQRAAWVAGGALLVIGAFVAWLLARSLTAPLANLTASARRIAHGDYSSSFGSGVGGPTEVRVLARAFDIMRAHIARTTTVLSDERDVLDAVLESTGDGILLVSPCGDSVLSNKRWRDLTGGEGFTAGESLRQADDMLTFEQAVQGWIDDTERVGGADFERDLPSYARFRCYTAPVAHADGRLLGRLFVLHDITRESEAERLRNAFMATMSHELRTPLAAITGYAGTLLSSGPWDDRTQREFLEIIERSAALLTRLVENLLDAAALEAGALRLDSEPVRVERLADEVVARLRPLATAHALQVNAEPGLPMADADPLRVEQIMTNLVENAIKYSPDGGPITVSLAATATGDLHVGVGDTGIGISSDEAGHIFERFYRAGNANGRCKRGAGLGLFVCRRLVEAHGGRIWVTSTPGVGSIFHFTLPGINAGDAVHNHVALLETATESRQLEQVA